MEYTILTPVLIENAVGLNSYWQGHKTSTQAIKPFLSWPAEVLYYLAGPLCILTHLSLASFLWDIGKQCKTRSDATKCGVWSGSQMFAYRHDLSFKI